MNIILRKLLLAILLMAGYWMKSQSKITVVDAETRTPIANALIKCKNKIIAKSNAQGIAEFTTKCRSVDVTAKGFYDDEVLIDKKMEAELSKIDPKIGRIETINIEDKSDPRAIAILKKVNKKYEFNAPKSLDSYHYKSYEKISLDFDRDTIQSYNDFVNKRMDSLKKLPERKMKENEKKDSLMGVNVMKLMGNSKMFLWERASEYLYSKKYGEKVNILDNRVSGLQQPIYEMMTLRSNRNKMPKEINEENFSLYRYFLTDSITIDGRENYVIRFRELKDKNRPMLRKFNGYLYVDMQTYALKKIESNSKKLNEGSITTIWKPIENKWFVYKEDMKLRAGYVTFGEPKKPADSSQTNKKQDPKPQPKKRTKFGNYVFISADYFDFKTPIEEKAADFKGYTLEVKNSDGSLLEKYRTQQLTDREQSTYTKIDSVGSKYKIDQKAKILTSLMRGKIRSGWIDFDLTKLLKYNAYEGFRLGTGVKLNEKFSKYISPDAYIAYGFKDRKLKYGAGIDVRTNLKKHSFFRAEYFNDVTSAGRFNENLWNFKMITMNAGVELKNDRFYNFEGFKISYETDITEKLTVKLAFNKQKETALFDYNFMNLGNSFRNSSGIISMKYAPKNKSIMTPSGKFIYEQGFPEFYLNHEQGFKSVGGEFNFTRTDAMVIHQFKTKAGVTGIRAYGGITTGDVPIFHHFSMNGLGTGKTELNFNLTSYLGFATMPAGKYYNDRFAGYYLTHRIPWYFRTFGKRTSSFDLVYRGAIGDFKYPEKHLFSFDKLNHLYQETGVEWNHFLSSNFNLGFFYRVGHYQTPNFLDNFAVQLKLNVLGF